MGCCDDRDSSHACPYSPAPWRTTSVGCLRIESDASDTASLDQAETFTDITRQRAVCEVRAGFPPLPHMNPARKIAASSAGPAFPDAARSARLKPLWVSWNAHRRTTGLCTAWNVPLQVIQSERS